MTFRQEVKGWIKRGSISELEEMLDRYLEEEYRQQNRRPDVSYQEWLLEGERQG